MICHTHVGVSIVENGFEIHSDLKEKGWLQSDALALFSRAFTMHFLRAPAFLLIETIWISTASVVPSKSCELLLPSAIGWLV